MEISLIQKRIADLEAQQEEISKVKQVLQDALMEDAKWQELDLQAREIAEQRKVLRQEIWNGRAYQQAVAKLKDIREEIKDLKELLNHELIQYNRTTDKAEVIAVDGTIRKISIKATVKKTNQASLF